MISAMPPESAVPMLFTFNVIVREGKVGGKMRELSA